MSARDALAERLDKMPLVAILRGLPPEDAADIGAALVEAGILIIEVPLNREGALDSIAALAKAIGDTALIGAGTITAEAQVGQVKDAGGRLAVMPHMDWDLVRAADEAGLMAVPGVMTPSEAFAARDAGAAALKLFPAESLGPAHLKQLRTVLPADEVTIMPVGGIDLTDLAAWWEAGASCFGMGAALYAPGRKADKVQKRAERLVAEMERVRAPAEPATP